MKIACIKITLFFLLLSGNALAQDLSGKVIDGKGEALIGANVHWIGTSIGIVTDADGIFRISMQDIADKRLVVSYVGYDADTIAVTDQSYLLVELSETNTLDAVEVKAGRPGTFISSVDPVKTEVITQTELAKAACCDLAGCFDTQGSVQPTTTNIVTNARELRILGLSGVYNQVLIDGMPMIQGLSYTYGISTIPGTLVDNIYVSKGANSVLQGFESIAGQINVELKEPDDTEKLLLNAYINSFLETQFNANYAVKVKKWSTIIAAHTAQPGMQFDRDDDTFLDLPRLSRYSLYNKWKYGNQDDWGWHSRIALRYVNERRIGGQTEFRPSEDKGTTNSYGQTVQFSQPEFYSKSGYRINDQHHLVLFVSAYYHDQTSYFGTALYEADQLSVYANLQYEFTWKNDHTLKSGISYRHQNLDEVISFGMDSLGRTYAGRYLKTEHIPGFFAEHIFNWKDRNISLITGIRADNHNDFGWYVTPRGLFKYNFTENTTARVSVGTGWRTVNLFSENTSLLASSRDVLITEKLRPEKAVNYGVNFTHKIFGEKVESQLTFDYYRSQFFNQVFPDYDTDATKAYVGNFTGKSVSNSFQAEIGMELFDRVGLKIAYNYLDVYRRIDGSKFTLPFNPKHRITSTLSCRPLNNKWHVDMNLHWYGEQRLANTADNPPEYRTGETSEPYILVNAQVTKNWDRVELYAGGENIFNFRQDRPIISWEDPFGPYFDTSSAWGPTKGWEVYGGVRVRME